MRPAILSINPGLRRAARVPQLAAADTQRVRTAEIATLALLGAAASLLTNVARFSFGIPGSNILFASFPMALGLALVPRRGAGTVMAGGALVTTGALWASGVRLDGVGAQTSLLLTGPLLDLALQWAHHGWRLYGAFVLACLSSNALAFAVRALAKVYGFSGIGRGGGGGGGSGAGGRPLELWLAQAVWTYAAAGIIAGLVSAAVWFHFRERHSAGDNR
ncbi:MAG TPA: hypothetical protein VJ803_05795 [Gemmatimonadaceae bacterium]|nr:hypothetical protein [Gemmatimonadaceae bacterium]